jgi:hypothetical protein
MFSPLGVGRMMSGDLMPFFMEGVKQAEDGSKTTVDIAATNNLILFLNLLPAYCGKPSNGCINRAAPVLLGVSKEPGWRGSG